MYLKYFKPKGLKLRIHNKLFLRYAAVTGKEVSLKNSVRNALMLKKNKKKTNLKNVRLFV